MNKVLTVLGTLLLAGAAFAKAPLPVLSGAVPIGGAGGWDYVAVDPASHRVYVSHESRMHVIDPAAGKVVAEIPDTAGVHGIAFAPEAGQGFITCGKSHSVAVLDLKTSKVTARLAAIGDKPDGVVFDPHSRRIFVMDNGGAKLVVVEPGTLKVLGTVALAGAPESSQPDLKGRLFVNLEDKNQVQVVDTGTLKVTATWSLAPHQTPTVMALDAANHRLFVGCRSRKLLVLNADTGAILAALPIGAGVDACAFDPATGQVFASCKDGTVAVIQAGPGDTYQVAGTLKTESGSKTLALDEATHQLYVPAAGAAKGGFQLLVFHP